MKKFEYLILDVPTTGFWGGKVDFSALTQKLNELGELGWEITSSTDTTMDQGRSRGVFIILKRPKQE